MVITANTAEAIPPNTPVEEVPIIIAREKAMVVKEKMAVYTEGRQSQDTTLPILAADTIVVLGNEIIGKPVNRRHAIDAKLDGFENAVRSNPACAMS